MIIKAPEVGLNPVQVAADSKKEEALEVGLNPVQVAMDSRKEEALEAGAPDTRRAWCRLHRYSQGAQISFRFTLTSTIYRIIY